MTTKDAGRQGNATKRTPTLWKRQSMDLSDEDATPAKRDTSTIEAKGSADDPKLETGDPKLETGESKGSADDPK